MIRSHERTTVTRGETLLDRLEEEITLLRKRHNDLEKLSHTDDHIHFLQVRTVPNQRTGVTLFHLHCFQFHTPLSFRVGSHCQVPQDTKTSTTSMLSPITPLMQPREPSLHWNYNWKKSARQKRAKFRMQVNKIILLIQRGISFWSLLWLS